MTLHTTSGVLLGMVGFMFVYILNEDEKVDLHMRPAFLAFFAFFFAVGLGVVMGAELNAALAESRPTALKGEIYSGTFMEELEVLEPEPGEDIEVVVEEVGVSRI